MKNKYTEMYLKYICFNLYKYIYIFMYLIKIPCNCTFSLLNWYN